MVRTEMLDHVYIQEKNEGTHPFYWYGAAIVVSFFLARTVFFEAAVPFFISLCAVVFLRYPQLKVATITGGLIGTLTLGVGQAMIAILQLLVLKYLKKWVKIPLALQVLCAVGIVQFFWQLGMHQGIPPAIIQFYVASEAILALVMTLFLSVVLLPAHRFFVEQWTTERLCAAFFVIAILFTGMTNSTVYVFNLAIIGLQVVVCVMALVSGTAIATVVATTLGIVMGVSQLSFSGMIALYAVMGVIAGSCKRFGKLGVALGSIVPSVLFFFYDASLPLDLVYFSSIGFAIILFFCIPKSWMDRLAVLIAPNQEQILLDRQTWLTHHMKQTMNEFQQFVFFMKDLTMDRFQQEQAMDKELQPFQICEGCFRYARCWQGEQEIVPPLTQYYAVKYTNKTIAIAQAEELLRRKCVKVEGLLEQVRTALYAEQMQQQLYHGRKMIGLQLHHMSEHIYHLLDQLNNEVPPFEQLEQELLLYLQEGAIPCFQVDIFANKAGKRQLYLACTGAHDEVVEVTERLLLPLLFEYFAEPFSFAAIEKKYRPYPYWEIELKSATRFQLFHKVYTEKKGFVSGDTHAVFTVQEQLVALVLSDGVGHDRLARQQSEKLVRLLQDCLLFMDPETAMHTIHYALSLEQQEDLYATLDFALVDLQSGALWSWKAGSVATYIVRGKQVLKIEGNSPPFGFMPHVQMETAMTTLQDGDLVLMVSDGLFDGAEGFIAREKAFLQLLKRQNRQKLAVDVLLYDVMAQFKRTYRMDDDCTILGCRVQHIQAEWSVLQVR